MRQGPEGLAEVDFYLRRNNEEPSNPFAKGPQRQNRNQSAKARPGQANRGPKKGRPQSSTSSRAEEERKKREAFEKMRKQQSEQSTSGPAKAGSGDRSATSSAKVPARNREIKQETRKDRLAELNRQKRVMEGQTEIKPATSPKQHESQTAPSEEAIASVQPPAEPVNVFAPKQKQRPKPGGDKPVRKPFRRREKKGGGRQPQKKKLDRRKYLEYKYEVRNLLDNPEIAEENRSNVLGQVWAKGERMGVEDAIEFIDQKQAELIIPEDVADRLKQLVKGYTTKR